MKRKRTVRTAKPTPSDKDIRLTVEQAKSLAKESPAMANFLRKYYPEVLEPKEFPWEKILPVMNTPSTKQTLAKYGINYCFGELVAGGHHKGRAMYLDSMHSKWNFYVATTEFKEQVLVAEPKEK